MAVPIVLNPNSLYRFMPIRLLPLKTPSVTHFKLADITKGNAQDYEKLIKTPKSRYVILVNRLSKDQKDKIEALKYREVGLQAQNYRSYPQGNLAAQLLGFGE